MVSPLSNPVPALSKLFLGANRGKPRRIFLALPVMGLFATTFAAYGLGLFSVSGGVVWIPYYAAVVGVLAAFGVGYLRAGLLFAWIVTYASLLGYHADHAFLGLSGRPIAERFAYFVRPDGLTFLAVEGVALGTLAFVAGALLRRAASHRPDASAAGDGG